MSATGDFEDFSSTVNHDSRTNPQIDKEMSVMDHLNELRYRIIYSVLFILAGFILGFIFRELIFKIALRPYGPDFKPIVLDVTERFLVYFKVAFTAGLVIASPFVIGQLWAFVSPALHPHEKKYIYPILPVVLTLFAAGAAFAYFIVLPVSLNYLLTFGAGEIQNQIRLERAIAFVTTTCLICGAVFQLPVVVFLLSKVGVVSSSFMIRQRKSMIVAIFILAAILTPTPDPLTMTIVALPMLLLYEISIYVAKLSAPKRNMTETK